MSKMSLRDLQSLFTIAEIKGNSRISKHQASKKGYKHNKTLSKGQKNHQAFMVKNEKTTMKDLMNYSK